MNEREKLLWRVAALNFSITDSTLYLDSHPQDQEALAYYQRQRDAYAAAVAEYENKFGPLTIFGNDCDTWTWTEASWPWELE